MRLRSEDKLSCVLSLLKGNAREWWETVEQGWYPHRPKWEDFLEEFEGKYVGETHIDTLRERFTHLVQGNRSVFAYEQEFLQLSRYAPELVAIEKMRCKRFDACIKSVFKCKCTR